jgi:hypothetical protein
MGKIALAIGGIILFAMAAYFAYCWAVYHKVSRKVRQEEQKEMEVWEREQGK